LINKLTFIQLVREKKRLSHNDGFRNWDSSFFEALYYKLEEQYKVFLPRLVASAST